MIGSPAAGYQERFVDSGRPGLPRFNRARVPKVGPQDDLVARFGRGTASP